MKVDEKWTYGDSWERFPIETGQIWGLPDGSKVAVHNLFDPLPVFMCDADLLFIDPPWNLGNLNTFYTKAGRSDYQRSFPHFTDAIFKCIRRIDPTTCYIEMGSQNVDAFEKLLGYSFPVIQRWPVTYYKKNPCWILRGSSAGRTKIDYSRMDEAEVIRRVACDEKYTVMGDFVMGRGLVGLAAHAAGKPFVGTELNPRRLAVLLDRLDKVGARVARIC